MTWLNRLQVRLIRVLGATLGVFDMAFGTRIGERLVDRLTHRWQQRLDTLGAELAVLDAEREGLEAQVMAMALQAAVYYLGARLLTRGEVRFDPGDPEEERMLDATIELLVKPRLATIESLEPQPGGRLYRIEPDWPAIRSFMEGLASGAGSSRADWLDECLAFIDRISEGHRD